MTSLRSPTGVIGAPVRQRPFRPLYAAAAAKLAVVGLRFAAPPPPGYIGLSRSAEARRVPRRVSALARWCQWPPGTCTAGTDRSCRNDRRFGRRSPAPERPRPLAPLVAFACFELGATVPCHVPGAAGCCRRALGASHAALPAQFACGLPLGAPSGRARAPSSPRVSNSRSLLEMRSGGRCQVPGAAGCGRRALGASHAAPPV